MRHWGRRRLSHNLYNYLKKYKKMTCVFNMIYVSISYQKFHKRHYSTVETYEIFLTRKFHRSIYYK